MKIMNIYVIFIYTFIFVILKSSNCSDQYPGYSTPDDTEDEDNNFDVSQSGQPHEQQYQPPTPHTTQPQPTQPEPVTYPGIQYPVYQPQPQKPYPGYQPVPYEQPQPYIPYQPPQPDQPYQPPPQPTQQILVTYPGVQYPGYQPEPYQHYYPEPYQQYPGYQPQPPTHYQPTTIQYQPQPPTHYQPTTIQYQPQPPYQPPQQQPILQPQQQPYYTGYRPTPTRDPSQLQKEYDQLPDKLTSATKYKETRQKELDFIKLYKKSKKGKLVLMTQNDYRKVFSNMFVTKYKLKSELEMLICNADTVYIHKTGNAYCTSITYNKKTNCFILTRNDGFLYIKLDDGRWRLKYRSFPDYVKLYTHDSYGNDVELNDEFYYLELTSKGSFKYRIKDDIRCTKIIVKQMLVWKQRDLDEPFPNVISVTIKMNVVLHYENYVIIYGIVRRQFKRLYIKSNKAGFNEY